MGMDGRFYQVTEELSSKRKIIKENILFLTFLSPTLRYFVVSEFCIKTYVFQELCQNMPVK